MTEIRTISGQLLFSFDENETTLAKEIEKHKYIPFVVLEGADLMGANLKGADLEEANLAFADLRGADLENANLWGANLKGANLKGAKLGGADLEDANLVMADLEDANLQDADLSNAKLEGAYLRYSNLSGADLRGANLKYANIRWANLSGANFYNANIWEANLERAKNVPDIPLACPSEGSFIAWKKVGCCFLVKLEIPEDAKRSSATTNKCRCDKAFVLDIENINNGLHRKMVVNENFCKCVYEVGKMVYPDSFDEDRWRECSNGIHFFVHKQDAIDY